VIRVLNFFRANDTVYMVMEYEHGRTLQELIQKNRAGVTENFIRNVFTKMLNGLREVHSHRLLHLDLKPSNIYMRNSHDPGADRLRRGTPDAGLRHADAQADVHTRLRLARALQPARSARPVERHLQCRRLDVCVHLGQYAATGRQPLEKDRMVPAMVRWEGQYSDQLLETIDWCLCLNHRYRPQSVFALQKALTEAGLPPEPARSQKDTWLRPGGRQIEEAKGP
jgi:serine/threonine protein kinase